MSKYRNIGLNNETPQGLAQVLESEISLRLDKKASDKVVASRKYLDDQLKNGDKVYYGVNTGFGSLCNIKISDAQLDQLQENLVLSHACGTGAEVPSDLVRLMMYLKIRNLSLGYSGVRLPLIKIMIRHFNSGITPVIFELGSLGASGDLAPLAHLSLPLLGKGPCYYEGKKMKAATALKKAGIAPIALKAKEGIALLNGTQFSLAYATWTVIHGMRLLRLANMLGAMSADAYSCSITPFDDDIHRIRNQRGQRSVAKEIRQYLSGSQLMKQPKEWVQDPYSFRCIPQVHGATTDALDYISIIVEREINAVTDNPNIFAEKDKIISGGNFHAQPLALSLDFCAIALAELGSISERRIFNLVNGDRGLPAYLTENPGLNSGLMISQYTAASIVSQNKQLCTPASVDSITSSKGQEDHVSMAANAATKCYRVVNNLYRILAIELLTAGQALELRKPIKSSPKIEEFLRIYRKYVPKLGNDRLLHDDLVASEKFIRDILKS